MYLFNNDNYGWYEMNVRSRKVKSIGEKGEHREEPWKSRSCAWEVPSCRSASDRVAEMVQNTLSDLFEIIYGNELPNLLYFICNRPMFYTTFNGMNGV